MTKAIIQLPRKLRDKGAAPRTGPCLMPETLRSGRRPNWNGGSAAMTGIAAESIRFRIGQSTVTWRHENWLSARCFTLTPSRAPQARAC